MINRNEESNCILLSWIFSSPSDEVKTNSNSIQIKFMNYKKEMNSPAMHLAPRKRVGHKYCSIYDNKHHITSQELALSGFTQLSFNHLKEALVKEVKTERRICETWCY